MKLLYKTFIVTAVLVAIVLSYDNAISLLWRIPTALVLIWFYFYNLDDNKDVPKHNKNKLKRGVSNAIKSSLI